MPDATPFEGLTGSQIVQSFAPLWALSDEGLGVKWTVKEVRTVAWEIINTLADELDRHMEQIEEKR